MPYSLLFIFSTLTGGLTMKTLKWFRNILRGLFLSIKRFPITILLSILVASVLITISETNPTQDTLAKCAMIFALGIPISLSIKLFFEEKKEESNLKLLIYYLAGALILLLYYLFLLKDFKMVAFSRYIGVSLIFYLCFIFIPCISKHDEFEMYVITLFTGFFATVIYSIVLFGGLSAILFTIDSLLGVKIQGKLYYYTWLFVVFLFAVTYFLSTIPSKDEKLLEKSYPRLLKILLLYIVMPLLTIYTLILYIYFSKIIVTRLWPVGLVSHLVLWYSIIVVIVIFFITPILSENNWANTFLKIAPKITLPLLIMMFVSIGIRIGAYGITENRYYVVILALWVFCIMLYFSINKDLKNIIIPITLSVVTLISVFGPISSYSISKYSQNKRFEKILFSNNMIKDGNIQSSAKISKEDKAALSGILDYFNKNHSLKDVKYIPDNFKMQDMNSVLGFSFESPIIELPYGRFYFMRQLSEGSIDIKGYDYLFDMRTITEGKKAANTSPLDASYDYESSIVKISYNGKKLYSKDLNIFIENILNKHGIQSARNPISEENTLSAEEMTFSEENENIKVKFVFLNISGNKNQNNNTIEDKGLEFYILVKLK